MQKATANMKQSRRKTTIFQVPIRETPWPAKNSR